MRWFVFTASGAPLAYANVAKYSISIYPTTGPSVSLVGTVVNTFIGVNGTGITGVVLPASVGSGLVIGVQDWGGNASFAAQIAVTVSGGGTIKGVSILSVANQMLEFVDTPNGWSSQ